MRERLKVLQAKNYMGMLWKWEIQKIKVSKDFQLSASTGRQMFSVLDNPFFTNKASFLETKHPTQNCFISCDCWCGDTNGTHFFPAASPQPNGNSSMAFCCALSCLIILCLQHAGSVLSFKKTSFSKHCWWQADYDFLEDKPPWYLSI